jgi:hypothetical protein
MELRFLFRPLGIGILGLFWISCFLPRSWIASWNRPRPNDFHTNWKRHEQLDRQIERSRLFRQFGMLLLVLALGGLFAMVPVSNRL